jgi:hypothetical protein
MLKPLYICDSNNKIKHNLNVVWTLNLDQRKGKHIKTEQNYLGKGKPRQSTYSHI